MVKQFVRTVMYICSNLFSFRFVVSVLFFSLAMDNREELVQKVNLFLYVQSEIS